MSECTPAVEMNGELWVRASDYARVVQERDEYRTANMIWEQTQMHPSLSAGGSADTDPVAGRVMPQGGTSDAADAKVDRLAVSNNGRPTDSSDARP